jgi:amino-acid N-acetyltransferase
MNNLTEFNITAADAGLKPRIISLLQANDLPVSDIDDRKDLFALMRAGEVVGTGGLEYFGDVALLRSISVRKEFRRDGLGKHIVRSLEMIAREKGIDCLYLLTTTAQDFFLKEGYEVIDRESAPASIKNSSEFSGACPGSAIAMKKIIK